MGRPGPLEVERPRLPWWTMLPRKLLLAASPIILVAVVTTVGIFVARRVWRYPLFLIGAAVLVGLGVGCSWWTPVKFLAALGILCGLWAWRHPDSFTQTLLRQARSEWRRAVVYAWPWRWVMLFSELTKRTGHGLHRVRYPRIRRVRADGWRDRVSVKLLHGQRAATYAVHADELANSFGARACRIRVDKPRWIWLDFIHADPLTEPVRVPALAAPGASADLARVLIGRTETGRPWVLRLADRHVLVAGVSDAGKSSVMWAVLRALAPRIRCGLVQVFGIDPKGGMELGRAPGLFHKLVCSNGTEAVELLEHVATLTRQRAEQMMSLPGRAFRDENGGCLRLCGWGVWGLWCWCGASGRVGLVWIGGWLWDRAGLQDRCGCPLTPVVCDRGRSSLSRVGRAALWELQCCFEHADQILLIPCSPCGQPPVVPTDGEGVVVLQEDQETEEIIARVAAVDIGKAEVVCCVRVPHEDKPGRRCQEVATHSTMTRSLLAMADHLRVLGVTRVVMEATSDYWKPVFYLLEAHGFDTWLVNARDVKHLPGRPKTDKLDAVWLCKVAERQMLRPSFVPPPQIRRLRDVTRYRIDLVGVRTAEKQRVEKLLEDAQIKLSVVASDIFGVSGRAMMAALVAGERRPAVLAQLARARMRAKITQLTEAFTGYFTDHHAMLLGKMLARIDALDADITELDATIEEMIAPFGDAADRLDEIPGIGQTGAAVVIAEVGLDMTRFPTAGHLASWAKLTPTVKLACLPDSGQRTQ